MLRVETLIRAPADFQVYRPAEGAADGPKDWRPLRKGVADLHRRAKVNPPANGRYREALAAVQDTTPLRQLAEARCRPVPELVRRPRPGAARGGGGRVLPRWSPRRRPSLHRDLRRLLCGAAPAEAAVRRRQAAAVTRKLRLLRGHGLLHKVPKTHRDVVSEAGRRTITALRAARNAAVEHLTGCAA